MNDNAIATAQALDASDPLRGFRERFFWPKDQRGEPLVYLCGNSLGLQPHAAAEQVQSVLDDWASMAVLGHFSGENPWLSYCDQAVPGLSRLIGCHADEVVAMNTLTVNLNLLMLSFFQPTDRRYKILIEKDAFPSDRYAVQSQLALHGLDPDQALVEWAAGDDGLETDALEALLKNDDAIALMILPGVQYLSGEVLDMPAIGALARRYGVTLGLDLAHAIGNVPMQMHDWQVDFAVFCTYKYLNAGPGAVAGAFIHRRHHDSGLPRLHGWWGNKESSRFLMRDTFEPAPGADAWQQSNSPVLSLAPVIASLRLFDEAGFDALRDKSIRLTGYLRERLEQAFAAHLEILTPRATDRQGCQLSIALKADADAGRALFKRIEQAGVIGDWREPNVIRVAPAPLYNSFEDVERFLTILGAAIDAQ